VYLCADYLDCLTSPSGSQESWTAAGVAPKVSSTAQRPLDTAPKSSSQATSGQKPSITPNSPTAHRTAQKSSPASHPLTRNIGPHLSPKSHHIPLKLGLLQAPLRKLPRLLEHLRKLLAPLDLPPSTGSKYSTPSQTQSVPRTSRPSAQTHSSPNAAQTPLTVSLQAGHEPTSVPVRRKFDDGCKILHRARLAYTGEFLSLEDRPPPAPVTMKPSMLQEHKYCCSRLKLWGTPRHLQSNL